MLHERVSNVVLASSTVGAGEVVDFALMMGGLLIWTALGAVILWALFSAALKGVGDGIKKTGWHKGRQDCKESERRERKLYKKKLEDELQKYE
jgi:hypothetical protein